MMRPVSRPGPHRPCVDPKSCGASAPRSHRFLIAGRPIAEDAQGMSPSLETRMVDPMRNRLGSGFPLPPRAPSGRRYWWTSTTQLPVASR